MPTRPDIQIRESTPADYQAIADIFNANDPDDPSSPEGLADRDKRRDPKCKHKRGLRDEFRNWVIENSAA